MNAHRPAKSRLTKKEKAAVDEYFNSSSNDYLRRVFKIFCIVLNNEKLESIQPAQKVW